MRLFRLITQFKNSLLFSGGLGILLGYVMTNIIISFHETMSVGNNPEVSELTKINAGSDQLGGKRIKIFCMVISSLGQRAETVNRTWGKRCDMLKFFTSQKSDHLNTVLLPEYVDDNRGTLWEKVKLGFSHAYSSYYDYDWFLKADDDTYVVMENLKMLLSGYNTSKAMFFGCRFNGIRSVTDPQRYRMDEEKHIGYMSGGAGYVLSREALRRFVEIALGSSKCFRGKYKAEDVSMGYCLEIVGVTFMDTRDYFGRLRFFPLMPHIAGYLRPGRLKHDFWYFSSMYYRASDGKECCAESAITFHYAHPVDMDLFEFFLYYLSPHQNH